MGYLTSYTLSISGLLQTQIPSLKELALMLKKQSAPVEQIAAYLDMLSNESDSTILTAEKLISLLRASNTQAAYAIDEEGNSIEPVKWYSCENDLREFSLKFPTAVFELTCLGEEPGAMHRIYVQAGKSYREKPLIVYNSFSQEKLK